MVAYTSPWSVRPTQPQPIGYQPTTSTMQPLRTYRPATASPQRTLMAGLSSTPIPEPTITAPLQGPAIPGETPGTINPVPEPTATEPAALPTSLTKNPDGTYTDTTTGQTFDADGNPTSGTYQEYLAARMRDADAAAQAGVPFVGGVMTLEEWMAQNSGGTTTAAPTSPTSPISGPVQGPALPPSPGNPGGTPGTYPGQPTYPTSPTSPTSPDGGGETAMDRYKKYRDEQLNKPYTPPEGAPTIELPGRLPGGGGGTETPVTDIYQYKYKPQADALTIQQILENIDQAGLMAPYGQRGMEAGGQILNTAFDPQNELRAREEQRLLDATRVGQSARGVTMSPYGANLESEAMKNFGLDWQDRQLGRQREGIAGYGAAGEIGKSMILSPREQAINDLLSYLSGGVSANVSQAQSQVSQLPIWQWSL